MKLIVCPYYPWNSGNRCCGKAYCLATGRYTSARINTMCKTGLLV